MKLVSVSFCIVALAVTTACSSMQASDEGDLAVQLEATTAAYTSLEKQGGAWRDTKEMLAKAKESLDAKDSATAAKLLNTAKQEVEMAKVQFESQKKAGPYMF